MARPLQLADLKKGREKGSVTVRVVRKWTVHETTGQCQPLFVGMVWADAKGAAIYAEIPVITIPEKEHLFVVGKIYAISKFRVCNAKPSYRPLNGSLMVEVTEYTDVDLAKDPPSSVPHHVYTVTPFPEIVLVDRTVYTYTDVLGYITKYTALETFIPKGKEKVTRLRKLHMKDLSGNEVKVTLWGDHAINFNINDVYDESKGNVVVILLLGTIPRREYDNYDKIYLSGSASCCYYLNPHIPEATPIYDRFKDTPVYIDRPPSSAEQASAHAEDKPLKQKTLADLDLINPFDFEDGCYKCAVTVTSIAADSNWWYRACKACKKATVQQPGGTYKCPRCDGTNIMPRYVLPFTAEYGTATARFFAYDEEAKQIVQKDCDAIMNPLLATQGVPQAVQDVVGKKYVFSIDLKDDTPSGATDRQYLVKAILDKPARRAAATALIASGTNPRPVSSTALSKAQAEGSSTPTKTSQLTSEAIYIQPAIQATPPPPADLDESPAKAGETRQSMAPEQAGKAQKSLLQALNAADQVSDKDAPATADAEKDASSTKNPPATERTSKRPRTAHQKDVSAHGHKESSSAHPST